MPVSTSPSIPCSMPVTTVRPLGTGGSNVSLEVCPFLRSRDGRVVQHPLRTRAPVLGRAARRRRSRSRSSARCAWSRRTAPVPPSWRPPCRKAGVRPPERTSWRARRPRGCGRRPDPCRSRSSRSTLDPGWPSPRRGPAARRCSWRLMVLAFIVVVIARTTSPSGAGASPAASAAASVPAVVASSVAPSLPEPTPVASISPSSAPSTPPSPSAIASASPGPSASPSSSPRTYRVRSGDTLSGIAATVRDDGQGHCGRQRHHRRPDDPRGPGARHPLRVQASRGDRPLAGAVDPSALAAAAVAGREPAGRHLGQPAAAPGARSVALAVHREVVADLLLERRWHALAQEHDRPLERRAASPRAARRPRRERARSACGTAAAVPRTGSRRRTRCRSRRRTPGCGAGS